MYRIFILLLIFDNPAASYNINIGRQTLQAEGHKHLKIVFAIWREIEYLSGHFSAHHKDCPSSNCGSTRMPLPILQYQKITIQLASLSPCKSYSTGFEIRAKKKSSRDAPKRYFPSQLSWKAISCPHLTTPTTAITTITTEEHETTSNGNSSKTEKSWWCSLELFVATHC